MAQGRLHVSAKASTSSTAYDGLPGGLRPVLTSDLYHGQLSDKKSLVNIRGSRLKFHTNLRAINCSIPIQDIFICESKLQGLFMSK